MTTPTATAAAAVGVSVETQIVPGGELQLKSTATDPNTSIEDAIQTFELLTLELPDSNQHVVEQNLGHPLTTFTCFPKLPLELRLIVWMYVLPGRRVVDLTTRIVRRGPRRSLPGLPIGLFINQESRRQALKFYTIFTQEHHSLRNWNSKPFALDPDVDLVRINARHAFGDFPHLAFMFDKSPMCIEKISNIEILDTDWFALYLLCRRQLEGNVHQNNFFKFLTGLRTLHVSELKNMSGWERMDYSQDAYEELVKLAEKERPEEPSAIPFPVIVFHTYRRKQTRSDHDDLHDSAVAYPWNGKWPAILQRPQNDEKDES